MKELAYEHSVEEESSLLTRRMTRSSTTENNAEHGRLKSVRKIIISSLDPEPEDGNFVTCFLRTIILY